MKTYNQDFYDDWYNDNKKILLLDFVDKNLNEFTEFCKEQFKIWCEDNE